MKNNKDAAKETAKTQPQTPAPAPVPNGKAKAPKAKKESAAKVEKDEEPADRLPTTVAELKESKSGFVTFLHLSGKEKEDIAKELAATFKLAEAQAVKIVRRITGRARFFRRAFDLMAAK
ncbi:MAG TPA: hypothetical protein PKM73_07275 [Verrucomicrobiota bacterium]|nr:hypothetical protein [Verrucomicrobiota bacterium]HNU50164.1 hypothetical protein [Verrucomicrobiota bacterium]